MVADVKENPKQVYRNTTSKENEKNEEVKEKIERLEQLIKESENPYKQYQARGLLFFQIKSLNAAMKDLNEAERLAGSPKDVYLALITKAFYYQQHSMFKEARQELEKLTPHYDELPLQKVELIKKRLEEVKKEIAGAEEKNKRKRLNPLLPGSLTFPHVEKNLELPK